MTTTAKQPRTKAAPKAFSVVPLHGSIDDLPKPNGSPYFVMTKRGPMIYKRLLFGPVLVPVREVPTLSDLPDNAKGYLWADAPALPWQLLNQAWAFFRWAWDERKSEAEVDIIWAPEGREARTARQGFDDNGFRLFVPPQTTSGGGVKLLRHEEHYRGDLVGTIHSHCNMSAYHSGTDTHDAEGHDGLHMTIGRVSANKPEIDVMVAANKVLWNKLPLADYTGGIADEWNKEVTFPEWWKTYHDHPEAKETFRGKSFASGARPQTQTQYPSIPSTGRGPSPKIHRSLSPYGNFKLEESDGLMELVAMGGHLPEEINPRQWLLDADLAFDMMRDAIATLEECGFSATLSMWFSKANAAKAYGAREHAPRPYSEENFERILGLWDDEDLDPDTRTALLAMANTGDVEVRETDSGVVVISRHTDEVIAEPTKKPRKNKKGTH